MAVTKRRKTNIETLHSCPPTGDSTATANTFQEQSPPGTDICTTIQHEKQSDNFAELVGRFQLALYRHYNSGGQSLYQPEDMRSFCQTHSPHLYDILLSSITRDDGRATSKNHLSVQEQRIVALLHTLAYFRSQKTSHLQKQAGMFLGMHGLTRSAQTAGRVLGFSTEIRMNDMFKQQQAKNHKEVVDKAVETACKNKKLVIHLLDDFHVINVLVQPTNKASSAIHMASSLLDIQPSAAVARPVNVAAIHSTTHVRKNGQNVQCRGGIVKTLVVAEMADLLANYH
ncbi:uncharacterized protein LOC144648103 [Oculina patagonica]